MTAATQQTIRDREREPRIDIENAHADQRLDLEQADVRRIRERVGKLGKSNRRELGHLQAELHAKVQGQTRAEVANEVLVDQTQPTQFALGKKRGITKVVG